MNPPTTQTTPSLTTGGKLDPFLPQLLNAINQATEIGITVAFIRLSGLDLIFDALKDAMGRGAVIRVLTSDYLDVTPYVIWGNWPVWLLICGSLLWFGVRYYKAR